MEVLKETSENNGAEQQRGWKIIINGQKIGGFMRKDEGDSKESIRARGRENRNGSFGGETAGPRTPESVALTRLRAPPMRVPRLARSYPVEFF